MKNQVVVKAGFIESRGQQNVVMVQIGVRIFKKDIVTRSEFALYHRDTNTLDLSGMPVAYYKGDEYRAGRITIDLDTDNIRLEGQVSGQVATKQNDTAASTKSGSSSQTADGTVPPTSLKPPEPAPAPPNSPDASPSAGASQ
jgi:lipopolysaccharide export system protein LptA